MTDIYQYRDELIAKLAQVEGVIAGMGGSAKKKQRAPYGTKTAKAAAPKKRRKMSAAAKAKIAAAQKARWAKFHAAKKK